MLCHVYRSERKTGAYLFVPEANEFDAVPDQLLRMLGQLTHTMELDLSNGRKLVQGEADEVIRLLDEAGYYLQLPPGDWQAE